MVLFDTLSNLFSLFEVLELKVLVFAFQINQALNFKSKLFYCFN